MTVAAGGGLLVQILHAALLLAAAPLVAGLTRSVRARLEGRRGPSPVQPYRDLHRGLRRSPVLAPGASPVAAAAPLVAVAALALAAGLLPPVLFPGAGPALFGPAPAAGPPGGGPPAAVSGDLVLVAALLGLGRFALALALSDAGTAAGGLGASRLAARPALFEPALLLVALCAAALAGAAAAAGGADAAPGGGGLGAALGTRAPLLLAAAALLLVAASDLPRPPVASAAAGGAMPHDLGDAPEAAGSDFSGWQLALWDYARALRSTLFLAVLAALLPGPPAASAAAAAGGAVGSVLGPLFGVAAFGLLCVALAAAESGIAALHGDRVQASGAGALALAASAAAFLLLRGAAA